MNSDTVTKVTEIIENLDKLVHDEKLNFGLDYFNTPELLNLIVDMGIQQNFERETLLFNIVKHVKFSEVIETKFQSLVFENNGKRLKIIKEIFFLIQQECYAGAIALLYGQFEGILTDFLMNKKLLKLNKNTGKLLYQEENFNYLDNKMKIQSFLKGNKDNKVISGLSDKVLIAQNYYSSFYVLKAYRINDENDTIAQSRNSILHGSDLDNFNLERTYILVIWFYVVCNWMSDIKNQQNQKISF